MSIKENIKEELLDYIITEEKYLNDRIMLNNDSGYDNFDCMCELNFLHSLKDFVNSI